MSDSCRAVFLQLEHRAPVRQWLPRVHQFLSGCSRRKFCPLYMQCSFSGIHVLQHSPARQMKGSGASLRMPAAFSYCQSRGQAKSGHLDYFFNFPFGGIGKKKEHFVIPEGFK